MLTRFDLKKFFIDLWKDDCGGNPPPATPAEPAAPTGPPAGANDRAHRDWMVQELNRPEPGEPEAGPSEPDAAPESTADSSPASADPTPGAAPTEEPTEEKVEGEEPAVELADQEDDEVELPWDQKVSAEAKAEGEEEVHQQGEPDPETGLTPEQDKQAREAMARYLFADSPDPDKALGLVLSTNRGKNMLSAFKTVRAIREEPGENGEGGIGYMPTLPQLREWMEDHYAMQRLYEDFQSGAPEKQQQVLSHFFGADEETGQLRPGAAQAISQLPRVLASNEATRPLYGSMAQQFVRGFAEHIKQEAAEKAAQYGDSETGQKWQNFYGNALVVIDYVLNGGKTTNGANGAVARPNGAARPEQESPEARRLREENERLRQQVGQAKTAEEQNYNDQFHLSCDDVLNQAADAILKPFASAYSEYAMDGLRRQIGTELLAAANKDQYFRRDVSALLRQAFEHRDPEMREQALNRYRQKIGSIAQRNARDYRARLRSSSAQQKQASDARHEKLAAGQSRTDPTSASGDPIAPHAQEISDRREGETTHDFFMRELSA